MTFFESLLALLAVAIVLLQASRRLAIPYPTMLAAAGVVLALIPGVPQIGLDPHTALALFIAPILVDAAFDFPARAVRQLWRPLVALAVLAVAFSTGAVAALGVTLAGLPLSAAIALGAIVAPPDAAAATAVLRNVSMPRRSVAILKGESLLNDASALLLFSAAIAVPAHGGINGEQVLQLGLAVPGGIFLGIVIGKAYRFILPIVSGTLGGNVLEFVTAFGVWIIAERLGLSAVLCLVSFAMTIAQFASVAVQPRSRIHSFAVWSTAVFLLNVLAFMLMGMQARTIVSDMTPERLQQAAGFAGIVIICLIAVRMAWVLIYNRLAAHWRLFRGDLEPVSLRHSVLVGWCGMRGLVTLATAFALPADFPQRDLIVLTAFAVVLATLVIQGLTLAPLVRLLRLDGDDGLAAELAETRAKLAGAALDALAGETSPAARHWRHDFEILRAGKADEGASFPLDVDRNIGRVTIGRQRKMLDELRLANRIDADAFLILQEELDFAEVALSVETERQIEES